MWELSQKRWAPSGAVKVAQNSRVSKAGTVGFGGIGFGSQKISSASKICCVWYCWSLGPASHRFRYWFIVVSTSVRLKAWELKTTMPFIGSTE